jgi:hypothetical protein
MKKRPTYDLAELQELLKKEETRQVMQRDRNAAAKLGYADEEEMVKRALKLRTDEFFKSMPSERYSNLMQDVYYTHDEPNKWGRKNKDLYIKLQKSFNGKCIIISFKESQ